MGKMNNSHFVSNTTRLQSQRERNWNVETDNLFCDMIDDNDGDLLPIKVSSLNTGNRYIWYYEMEILQIVKAP